MISTPRDALIHEIATALESSRPVLCEVPTRRGFPASQSRDDDFALPSISISVQSESGEKTRRKIYRETELEGGNLETLFEIERKAIEGTLELWTKDKTEREPIELELDALFGGAIPDDLGFEEPGPPGLVLDLSLLYDVRVRVLLVDKNVQDASGGRDGYFRILYSFEATVPQLVRVEYKKATLTTTATVDTDVEC